MAIVKCEKGHFYDDVKYDECPHCKADSKKPQMFDDNEKTVAKIASDKQRNSLVSFVAGKDERTVSIFSSKGKFMPVVGWLVCTEGNEKGRDYRIISGRNFIGRAHQMDITIADDPEITRENHCSLVFDPKSLTYSLIPGVSVVYRNGEKVLKPVDLAPYDTLTLGKTTLQFIPYCKEGIVW